MDLAPFSQGIHDYRNKAEGFDIIRYACALKTGPKKSKQYLIVPHSKCGIFIFQYY